MPRLLTCNDSDLLPAIERARQGDSVAFEVIYDHCIDAVRFYCRKELCWTDYCMQFEEDLASEVMMAMWKSLCDPANAWRTSNELWCAIRRLISEHCINRGIYNKRQKRRINVDLPVLFRELYGHRVFAIGIAEVDAEDVLQSFLKKLPENELREFVVLKLRGLTNDEIARKWRTSTRSVRRKMEAARRLFEETILI